MLTIIDIHEDKLRYSDLDWWQYNKKYENERTWLISRNCQNLHFAIVQILDLPIVWACRWTCETTLSDAPITYGSLLEGAFSLCVRLKFFQPDYLYKLIRKKKVQTEKNVKPKTWSNILGLSLLVHQTTHFSQMIRFVPRHLTRYFHNIGKSAIFCVKTRPFSNSIL